jgi:anti-anti-sigma regulatory factor
MDQQVARGAAVVVALPVEIDVTNANQVYDRLAAATRSGAAVVIADATGTMFCDAAGGRRLVMIHARAAARGVPLRLVIPSGGLLRRVLELLGVDSLLLPVYASTEEAQALLVPAARDPLACSPHGRPEGTP